jgi:DNA-binding HxlR family transcriptional regulator
MLGIIYAVGFVIEPPARFGDILAVAKTSQTTVSRRLQEAVAAGLLRRQDFDENPPRVEYTATPTMRELDPALLAMNVWCRRHALFAGAASMDRRDRHDLDTGPDGGAGAADG